MSLWKNKNVLPNVDSSILINAYTVALTGCLIPLQPFSTHLMLTLSIYSFTIVAVINHLFPKRFHFLTHVVKALYTVLLFVSIQIYPGIIFSLIDLLPLAVKNKFLKSFFETTGAIIRMAAIIIGFYLVNFNLLLLTFYVVCSFIYFFERRTRIKNGKRYNYDWSHHTEHLALGAFLLTVNYDKLNHFWVGTSALLFSGLILLGLIIAGKLINRHLHQSIIVNLPPWFDEKLTPHIYLKSQSNYQSKKLYNYCFKPFTPPLAMNALIQWKDLEYMIANTPIQEPVNMIIGILSGGAFIANYVGKFHQINQIAYISSKLWSNCSLFEWGKKATKYYCASPIMPFIEKIESLNVKDQTILLIDDSITSGTTIQTVKETLYGLGAKKIMTYALFCHPNYLADYYYAVTKTPIIWPWGWEAD